METLLVKAMQRAQYFVAGRAPEQTYPHYALNLPLYTHFAQPTRRYADIVVHRQLEAVLSDGAVEFSEEVDSLVKTAEHCNHKKDCAMSAQEQSVHIESCRSMDKKRQELGTDLISEGIVICVYESAFDVLIPEYGFEKRVHCDQLPLKKAEFDKNKRVLELYWEKGVPSSAYVPEDERPKAGSAHRGGLAGRDGAAQQAAKERDDAQQRQMEPVTMSSDDVDALFDDEDDPTSEATDMMAGVSLNQTSSGNGGSGPASEETQNKSATTSANRAPEAQLTNKEKYTRLFSLREENGQHIQDVTEMTRVPVILKTDLTKSPPYVVVCSVLRYSLFSCADGFSQMFDDPVFEPLRFVRAVYRTWFSGRSPPFESWRGCEKSLAASICLSARIDPKDGTGWHLEGVSGRMDSEIVCYVFPSSRTSYRYCSVHVIQKPKIATM